jgi:hypothetical protein
MPFVGGWNNGHRTDAMVMYRWPYAAGAAMYISLGTVVLGVLGALMLTGFVNILYRRKPWDLSP